MAFFAKALNRWKIVLLITLVTRLALFALAFYFNPDHNRDFWSIWVNWDGPHYLEIAKNGYQTTGDSANFIVFYPLYPLLVHLVSLPVTNINAAAVLVSTFFAFLAAIFLYELTLLDFSKKTAILSVWFLNIFPLSYFLQASYTESLFLAMSIGAIYFFRTEKYFWSTIFGIFSSFTRINGLILSPYLLLAGKLKPKSLIPIFLTPLGFIFYAAINYYYFKDPLYFFKPLLNNWYKKSEWPWVGILNAVHSVPPTTDPNYYIFASEPVALFILLILSFYVLVRVKFSYGIYMLLNFLLFTSTSFILSTPRYSLILFPIYIAFADIKNKAITFIISLLFILLLVKFTLLYTQGQWAY